MYSMSVGSADRRRMREASADTNVRAAAPPHQDAPVPRGAVRQTSSTGRSSSTVRVGTLPRRPVARNSSSTVRVGTLPRRPVARNLSSTVRVYRHTLPRRCVAPVRLCVSTALLGRMMVQFGSSASRGAPLNRYISVRVGTHFLDGALLGARHLRGIIPCTSFQSV